MTERIDRRDFARLVGGGLLAAGGVASVPPPSPAASGVGGLKMGFVNGRRAAYFAPLSDGAVRCDLCPHRCRIDPGRRGRCGVRENAGGILYTLAWGNPCAVNVDPIEKKPLYHVLPGTRTLSLATAGCNLRCKSCLNWEASQARPEETFNYELPPAEVVRRAETYGCASIASSYVEPVVFFEYMLEVARLCRDRPLLHVMHSAGYIEPAPLGEICRVIDAACIDLKGFTEATYRDLVGGELSPVLEALTTLKQQGVHTEVVNLVIPGKTDDPKTLRAMCRWIHRELGPETPLHFYRFYPRYRLKTLPPTPVPTLERAREIAAQAGLRYAYIANVPEHPGKHTWCPECGELLIRRVGLITEIVALVDGRCGRCGHAIRGLWRQRT